VVPSHRNDSSLRGVAPYDLLYLYPATDNMSSTKLRSMLVIENCTIGNVAREKKGLLEKLAAIPHEVPEDLVVIRLLVFDGRHRGMVEAQDGGARTGEQDR
jgi:hypothetical protein